MACLPTRVLPGSVVGLFAVVVVCAVPMDVAVARCCLVGSRTCYARLLLSIVYLDGRRGGCDGVGVVFVCDSGGHSGSFPVIQASTLYAPWKHQVQGSFAHSS